MTRTVKACITFLLLLLVAASVFAVLYSQGVLDAIVSDLADEESSEKNGIDDEAEICHENSYASKTEYTMKE